MKKLTRWIAARLIRDHENIRDVSVRAGYGSLEGWVSIVLNILLFAVKLAAGISVRSIALIADAVHTLADSATSVVVIIGFKIAQKPSDKKHPFGHGRMEPIATLIVSVLLFVAGVELLEKSFHSIFHTQASPASTAVILLILGTAVIKELMTRFSFELGEIIDSDTLKADAMHHRTDVIATILVVVALVASRYGYDRVDGVMGLLVSFIIFYTAVGIARDAINSLLGEAPSRETVRRFEKTARSHEGVLGVHDVICHRYGQTSIISLHIEVSDKATAMDLHALSERVEEELAGIFGSMMVVHIDPINPDHPYYGRIREALDEIVAGEPRAAGFHELRIVGSGPERCNAVFDVVLAEDVPEKEGGAVVRAIREKFRSRFPDMKCVIKAEPKYAFNL